MAAAARIGPIMAAVTKAFESSALARSQRCVRDDEREERAQARSC